MALFSELNYFVPAFNCIYVMALDFCLCYVMMLAIFYCAFDFTLAYVLRPEYDLSVQIVHVDYIVIDYDNFLNPQS